uniref:Lysine-rich arabinogalactan protein 19-like n=1 Tax=Castor canadensis TaxID=51338 RepID=A0A8B7TK60_CASCN|nr:lysine-rich arabinogalactan protein 19-like [Castor canadensis]
MREARSSRWELAGADERERPFSFPAVGHSAGAVAAGTRGPDRAARAGPASSRAHGGHRTWPPHLPPQALALTATWSPRKRRSRSVTADSSTTRGPRQPRAGGGAGTPRRERRTRHSAQSTPRGVASPPGAISAQARGVAPPPPLRPAVTHGNGRRVRPEDPHVSRVKRGRVGWTPPPCPGPTLPAAKPKAPDGARKATLITEKREGGTARIKMAGRKRPDMRCLKRIVSPSLTFTLS